MPLRVRVPVCDGRHSPSPTPTPSPLSVLHGLTRGRRIAETVTPPAAPDFGMSAGRMRAAVVRAVRTFLSDSSTMSLVAAVDSVKASLHALPPLQRNESMYKLSLLLKRAEATLQRHVCGLWRECDAVCQYHDCPQLLSQTLSIWKALPLPAYLPDDDPTVPAVQAPEVPSDRHDDDTLSTPLMALMHRVTQLSKPEATVEVTPPKDRRAGVKTHRLRLFEMAVPTNVRTAAHLVLAPPLRIAPALVAARQAEERQRLQPSAEVNQKWHQSLETAGWMGFQPPATKREPLWMPAAAAAPSAPLTPPATTTHAEEAAERKRLQSLETSGWMSQQPSMGREALWMATAPSPTPVDSTEVETKVDVDETTDDSEDAERQRLQSLETGGWMGFQPSVGRGALWAATAPSPDASKMASNVEVDEAAERDRLQSMETAGWMGFLPAPTTREPPWMPAAAAPSPTPTPPTPAPLTPPATTTLAGEAAERQRLQSLETSGWMSQQPSMGREALWMATAPSPSPSPSPFPTPADSTEVETKADVDEADSGRVERGRLQSLETAGWMGFQPSTTRQPLWMPPTAAAPSSPPPPPSPGPAASPSAAAERQRLQALETSGWMSFNPSASQRPPWMS